MRDISRCELRMGNSRRRGVHALRHAVEYPSDHVPHEAGRTARFDNYWEILVVTSKSPV